MYKCSLCIHKGIANIGTMRNIYSIQYTLHCIQSISYNVRRTIYNVRRTSYSKHVKNIFVMSIMIKSIFVRIA